MKRKLFVALLSEAILFTMMSLTSCNKDTLQYTMTDSDWTGAQHIVYAEDTVQVIDNVTMTVTFSENNCRLSGSFIELRDSLAYIKTTFDYFGTYTYKEGKGVIMTNATSLSGGKALNFTVADASKMSLTVPANFFGGKEFTVDLNQRSNLEY